MDIQAQLVNMGLGTPSRRFLLATAVIGAGIYYMKPSMFFDDKGMSYPSSAFASKDQILNAETVMIPWYLATPLLGFTISLF